MLTIDLLEGVVIRMQDKGLSFEVMNPMSQGPHNSIELFFTGVIVALDLFSFSLKYGIGLLD